MGGLCTLILWFNKLVRPKTQAILHPPNLSTDMKNIICTLALGILCLPVFIGCSDPAPSNMVENADANAIADYERMVAEDSAAMDTAMANEGTEAAPAATATATAPDTAPDTAPATAPATAPDAK